MVFADHGSPENHRIVCDGDAPYDYKCDSQCDAWPEHENDKPGHRAQKPEPILTSKSIIVCHRPIDYLCSIKRAFFNSTSLAKIK